MNGTQFTAAGIKVYGRKKWKAKLAADLGIDEVTVWRYTRKEQVPGPVEVALNGLMEHRRQQAVLEKAARKLLPRKFRHKKGKKNVKIVRASRPLPPIEDAEPG